jgi:hypothetical protein
VSGPFRQTTEFELLHTVGDRPDHQIAADARRLRANEPPPFLTQRRAVEIAQPIQVNPQSRRARRQIRRGRIDGRRVAAQRFARLHLFSSPPVIAIR